MKAHYIPENRSTTTRKFIPVQEWNSLKSESLLTEGSESYHIPDWQKEIVLKRIQAFESGTEELLDFEEAMKEIEKDL
ncbi:addiction module protein [Dyadobacter aurulentus]|uniref:addiction module protein n=1 Tax=Dyadobacter sp. UC 10 TaxID=2605428 RepID=UPI0011F3DF94|nr:addiction module protein [Dyadobacter sp. UC 10]KAA0990141.1 addiction module protein [Dyadobacter sp. UC 10]